MSSTTFRTRLLTDAIIKCRHARCGISYIKILPGYFLFVDRYQLSPHHKFQRRRKNSSQRRTLQALQFCLHAKLFNMLQPFNFSQKVTDLKVQYRLHDISLSKFLVWKLQSLVLGGTYFLCCV